jgi:hypothetical protein
VTIGIAMLAGLAMTVLIACPGLDRTDSRAVEPERHHRQQQAGNAGG